MVNRKTASVLSVAALLVCAIPVKSTTLVSNVLISPVIGQTAPSFSIPDSVPKGTRVRVSSSSDNMNAITAALGSGFESKYSNSKVDVATKEANAAIQDVLNDNADLAAISRPLTEEEKAKGLIAIPVRREKIAIVVGTDNPFAQSITGSQFAQIFRGEVKDWGSVGGAAGPIRVIDRPDVSETRQALRPYPVFATADFKTGDNATQIGEDSTDALATELGKDGIGYALVGELEGQTNIKALQLHKTPPSDSRYPFSQPYAFVYNGGASPAATAFLGYATGTPGQAAIEEAGVSGYSILPGSTSTGSTSSSGSAGSSSANSTDVTAKAGTANGSATDANKTAGGTAADGAADGTGAQNGTGNSGATAEGAGAQGAGVQGSEAPGAGAAGTGTEGGADAAGTGTATSTSGPEVPSALADGTNADGTNASGIDVEGEELDNTANPTDGVAAGRGRWWWLLLPLAGLGLLLWAAGKRGSEEETGYIANADDEDRIRSNAFQGGNLPEGKLGTLGAMDTNLGTSVGAKGTGTAGRVGSGIGKAVAGGTALAGGAAAAGAGIAGRMKNKAGDITGDITMDLDGIKSTAQGNVDGAMDSTIDRGKSSAQSGMGNIRSNITDGVDGVKGTAEDSIDGLRSNLRSGQDKIDGLKGSAQGSIESSQSAMKSGFNDITGNVQSGVSNLKDEGGSWLDRAKQRINEAADQVKDKATDIKEDVTKD
ncbi:MAG: substrate-binding domain-containing protein [Cyanobacteria bacterium J06649_5]